MKQLKNIRFHFPNNEIILQIDGIREEQRQYEDEYNEYKNKVLWKCLHEYKNILPIIFDKHSHQTTMMKKNHWTCRNIFNFIHRRRFAIKN